MRSLRGNEAKKGAVSDYPRVKLGQRKGLPFKMASCTFFKTLESVFFLVMVPSME